LVPATNFTNFDYYQVGRGSGGVSVRCPVLYFRSQEYSPRISPSCYSFYPAGARDPSARVPMERAVSELTRPAEGVCAIWFTTDYSSL
jgi:hypothetical protein